jgi:phosphotransferase system enzyme I (PtsI)
MKELVGVPASSGVAIGKVFLYKDDIFSQIPRYSIQQGNVEGEWKRFVEANQSAQREVQDLRDRAQREMGDDQAKIFEAHLLMLSDEDIHDQLKNRLESNLENIEWIVWENSRALAQKLSTAQDPALRDRAADIYDVSRRLLNNLLSIKKISLTELTWDCVLVAHDLLPSDALIMNKSHVKALVLDMGGMTSHTAILARAFEIPAVLGLSNASLEIKDGDTVAVDGDSGRVIVNPDETTLQKYRTITVNLQKIAGELGALRDLNAETLDGVRVQLKANIEIPEEAEHAIQYGAEGIGLYRSEFLFLTQGSATDEEQQYRAYRTVVSAMGGKPVTIRTLDVGGDKLIPELQSKAEKNPLLGWRAIRFCLSHRDLFKTQLRALLRSSVEGNLKIMFPMISGIEELEDALAVLEEAKAECRKRGQAFAENLEVGTMIEIPSAAMTADILAKRSAFFSIGTNDLVQYSIAVDRGNERTAYLAQPFHPAVLRFIKRTIDAAHTMGIPVAMCGELAGDPQATGILLGLGLDEFSMSASSIPRVKKVIRSCRASDCRLLAENALALSSYRDVQTLVQKWMDQRFPA